MQEQDEGKRRKEVREMNESNWDGRKKKRTRRKGKRRTRKAKEERMT